MAARVLICGSRDFYDYAFPLADSRGTWDMVRRAKKANVPVHIFENK